MRQRLLDCIYYLWPTVSMSAVAVVLELLAWIIVEIIQGKSFVMQGYVVLIIFLVSLPWTVARIIKIQRAKKLYKGP